MTDWSTDRCALLDSPQGRLAHVAQLERMLLIDAWEAERLLGIRIPPSNPWRRYGYNDSHPGWHPPRAR